MAKVILAQGARGPWVERVQRELRRRGFNPGAIDGVYGARTREAVAGFQASVQVEPTGEIDDWTWSALLGTPLPSPRDRCIQLTADFEGHGFSKVVGNFDGAGLTWGIVGFTLRYGQIKRILLQIQSSHPDLLREAFGARTDELLDVLNQPIGKQIEWADRISLGADKTSISKPWREGFARLGEFEVVREIQLRVAEEEYYLPAVETARQYQLQSELGLALAFDIHVQNGGIGAAALRLIRQCMEEQPVRTERERRIVIAHAVADAARAQYREDVRARKLAIAVGAGKVHGRFYVLQNWGLTEDPAIL